MVSAAVAGAARAQRTSARIVFIDLILPWWGSAEADT
jgi:hypothetical protein